MDVIDRIIRDADDDPAIRRPTVEAADARDGDVMDRMILGRSAR